MCCLNFKNLFKQKEKGVNPFIATVYVIAITFTGITLVLTIGIPTINKARELSLINEAIQNMRVIDNTIRQVASEGIGSLKTIQVKITDGEIKVNSLINSVDFNYLVKYGSIEPGTLIQEENLEFGAGVNAKASEYDFNNDNVTDLVLENEILRVAIQKVGSAKSQAPINTSNNIKLIQLIEKNFNVTPTDSSVVLDGFADTGWGNGYSQLVKTGTRLAKAEAIVVINATSVYYEIVYTLPSGADYLLARVQNARFQ